jgi:hypothetical protein
MKKPLMSYEDRVAKIKTIEDIDKQMELAKSQAMQARARAKGSYQLGQKLALQEKANHHESVLRQLRINRFNLEDKINQLNIKS